MGLSLEDMARLSTLLDSAMELDAAGRQQWLDRLPGELQPYRDALRAALLGTGDASVEPSFLETLPRFSAPPASQPDTGAARKVGPYTLLRAIGSGGMGTVWLAERSDGAYQRKVALKLPRLEMAQGMLLRWSRERDILAGLEHPNIARLYDAGVDAANQPYLALEYVDGQPIDRHAQGLDPRQRVALFLQVTEAVAYAHSAGVIHRDLKPSNILVDGKGQVHLLDFGIAKIMEPDASAGATQLTELAGSALTPDYASPEQLCGDRLRANSDIYSLAVILYGMLAGALPFQFQGRRTQAVANALRSSEPPLASQRATTPEARRLLLGDLDAILARALRKDPDERYASVAAFGADLRRYLDGKPVMARQQGWSYRLRKFAQRNRAALLGSLALVVISAGLGYAFKLLGDRVHAAEPPSIRERMSIVVLPFNNQTGDPAQAYVAEGLTTSLTADLSRIRDAYVIDPITATALRGNGLSAHQIGEQLGVRYVLTGSVQSSGKLLRVRAQLADARTSTQLWSDTFEGDQANLFKLQDQVTGRVGNSIGREMVLRGAREGDRSTTPQVADLILRARALEMQAATLGTESRREALWRQVLRLDPDNTKAMASLATLLVKQGHVVDRGAPPDAKDAEGRDLALKARERDPDDPDIYYALVIYYIHQQDAAAELQAAEKRLALDPNSPNAFNLLGNVLMFQGDPRKAIEVFEHGLALDPDSQHPLDKLLANLGEAYLLTGQFDRSRDSLLHLQEIEPLTASSLARLAMDYAMLGERGKASAAAAEARKLDPTLSLRSEYLVDLDRRSALSRKQVQSVLIPAWRRASLPE